MKYWSELSKIAEEVKSISTKLNVKTIDPPVAASKLRRIYDKLDGMSARLRKEEL